MAKLIGTLIVSAFVHVALCTPVWADQASELEDLVEAGSEFNGDQRLLDREVQEYLEGSRRLRAQSEQDIARLVTAICATDLEPEENYGTDIALQIAAEASSRIRDVYGPLEDDAEELLDDIEDFLNEMKSTRDRFRALADNPEVGAKAKTVLDDIASKIDASTKRYDEVQKDLKAAANVADGVMQGANNPKIRAAMDYGRAKHKDMQSSLSCDDKEVVLPSGKRADCVKFDVNSCMVIEIKPDSSDMNRADDQVRGYAEELKRFYAGSGSKSAMANERCEKDSNGDMLFKKRIETYSACKP